MADAREKAHAKKDTRSVAIHISEKVKPYFDIIRHHADALELMVDDSDWKLPKYREMLFIR